MRKRVIPLILMLILGIVLVLGFSSCGDEENGDDATGGGGNGGDKTPLGLAIVDENGDINQGAYSFGKIEYGSKPNLDSVKIYMGYMDGSNAEISKADLRVSYMKPDGSLYPSEPANFLPGVNAIVYSYDDNTSGVTITFEVVTTATKTPYQVSVDKKTWKYGQTATATVTNEGNALEANDFTDIRLITQAKYNEIKDSNNFVEDLRDNSVLLNGAKPGQYYIFAFVNYSANSKFESVTIEKANLVVRNEDMLNSSPYNYGTGKVGNIKLSDLWFLDYTGTESGVYVTTEDGTKVYGSFAWVNPNEEVNSAHSGQTRKAKFVPEESLVDCYNDATVDVILTINKAYVVKPHGTTSERYTGNSMQVFTGEYASNYSLYVNVMRNGTSVQVQDNGYNGCYIDSITAVGKYTYTLELKDKVNYYWVDKDDMGNHSDFEDNNSDVTFEFDILPMLSKVQIDNIVPLLVDADGYIMLEIAQYCTPYVAGTLSAEWVSNERFTANVEIVSEGGKDYLKIFAISRVDTYSLTHGVMPVKFTATGADNYDDIDCTADVYIYTDAADLLSTNNVYEGMKMKVYAGTPVSELYKQYVYLTTSAGEWTFYYSGMKIDKGMQLPYGGATTNCKFVMYDGTPAEVTVNFQIVCIDPQNPLDGDTVTFNQGSITIQDIYARYPLIDIDGNMNGSWCFTIKRNGNWEQHPSLSDSTVISAGTYECRLEFVGDPDIIGTQPQYIYFTLVVE